MNAEQVMAELACTGHEVRTWTEVEIMNSRWRVKPTDFWEDMLAHRKAGWFAPGKFYVYVAYAGGRLGPSRSRLGQQASAFAAVGLSVLEAMRYDHVWVACDAGVWKAGVVQP